METIDITGTALILVSTALILVALVAGFLAGAKRDQEIEIKNLEFRRDELLEQLGRSSKVEVATSAEYDALVVQTDADAEEAETANYALEEQLVALTTKHKDLSGLVDRLNKSLRTANGKGLEAFRNHRNEKVKMLKEELRLKGMIAAQQDLRMTAESKLTVYKVGHDPILHAMDRIRDAITTCDGSQS